MVPGYESALVGVAQLVIWARKYSTTTGLKYTHVAEKYVRQVSFYRGNQHKTVEGNSADKM